MREYDINKNLYKNIEISDELRDSLITDVKKGKRTADKRFRYSSALMAACIVGTLAISGGSASAAYKSYKGRLENMSEQEQTEYTAELEADTHESDADAFSRELTKAEKKRLAELQDEYYKNDVFPKESMPHLDKLSELQPDMLAYVAEDNMVHFPENELSDEQLLQYIDHQAKYTYTIEQNVTANEDASVEAEESEYDVEFDISEIDEETLKDKTKELIKKCYGEEVDDSWIYNAYGADFSQFEGEGSKNYVINWMESEADNCKMYQIMYPVEAGGNFMISKSGYEVFADAEEFTEEEAQQYKAQGEERVKKYVEEHFGLGEPDRIDYAHFENGVGETIPCEWISFNLYYGDDYVTVDWVISTDDILGISGKNLLK